ncbi:MAG: cysteine hydrolase family protein [Acidimicrobiales bacterium]
MIRGLEAGQRPALLMNECQRGVLDSGMAIFPGLAEQARSRGIVANVIRLADSFRRARHPVLHLQVAHRRDWAALPKNSPLVGRAIREARMVQGSEQVEPMPGLEPQPVDFVSVRSSGMAPWYGTDLDSTLRKLGVQTLVWAGVSTDIALFGGALGGIDRGYQCVLAEDCSAGSTPESHEFMVANTLALIATIATSEEVIEAVS